MAKTIPLDEQIHAVLRGICSSEQAAAVLADARRELADLTQRADAADVASLNPLATSAEAKKLRAEASDHQFDADRMEASVSALEARLSELKEAEDAARRDAHRAEVKKRRDALADEIRSDYPELVRKLASLAKRIQASDAECKPVGLESAEALGRDMPSNFYWMGGPVHRIIDRAPAFGNGNRLAWEHLGIGGTDLRFFALEGEDA